MRRREDPEIETRNEHEAPPALVEVVRGSVIESRHRGVVAVVDARGRLVAHAGDPRTPVTLRSGVKPFTLAALGVAGGFEAFGLTDEELAVMSASHEGTDREVAVQERLLERVGIARKALRSPASFGFDEPTKARLIAAGEPADPIRHMCSGFHIASLLLSLLEGWPLDGYMDAAHPSQVASKAMVETIMGGRALDESTDDCGLPTWAYPAEAIAGGFALLASPRVARPELDERLLAAFERIRDAMRACPVIVAGPTQTSTLLMRAMPDRIVGKEGAEGLLGIGLTVADAGEAAGVAITIEDGDRMRRATPIVAIETLRQLGVIPDPLPAEIASRARPATHDQLGREVAMARPAFRLVRP